MAPLEYGSLLISTCLLINLATRPTSSCLVSQQSSLSFLTQQHLTSNMSNSSQLPDGLISYGPNTNCTLDLCPVDSSALEYRPSLGASGAFISLFSITMIIHIAQGFHWKTWAFTICMVLGCVDEIVGYAGRIMLYYNPFSFGGFLIEISTLESQEIPKLRVKESSSIFLIVCITTAPVFFCAAIYVTLSKT